MLKESLDEAVAFHRSAVEIARLVVPGPGRVGGIEHGLQLRVGHRADRVDDRWAEPPEGLHQTLAVFDRPAMAQDHRHDGPAVVPGGDQYTEREVVGCTRGLLAEEIDDVAGLAPGKEQEPRQHGRERMELELERRDDAEVAAATSHPPEELRVLVRARARSEEHTSELQSRLHLVCRLLL